ncbi:HNH endonuclease [Arthrobacter sp. TE12232]
MEFYSAHPTATTSWRLAILMGANTRTYKFALASALLEHARAGRAFVTLRELAEGYSRVIVQHSSEAPQAREVGDLAGQDFLSIVGQYADDTLQTGTPSEPLVEAAVRSMPGMVMRKFHNLRGGIETPHRFYNLRGSGPNGTVEFTPELMAIAESDDLSNLDSELDARWRIVETSFESGVGRSLISEGFGVNLDLEGLVDRRRRRSVAGLRPAVLGFQYGRCLICHDPITESDRVAIDHVFPFSLMNRGNLTADPGLDLDSLWNLSPAHAVCNSRKSNRPPTIDEVRRLGQRNEAIMLSPHPLRRTLELSLALRGIQRKPGAWYRFLATVL